MAKFPNLRTPLGMGWCRKRSYRTFQHLELEHIICIIYISFKFTYCKMYAL